MGISEGVIFACNNAEANCREVSFAPLSRTETLEMADEMESINYSDSLLIQQRESITLIKPQYR